MYNVKDVIHTIWPCLRKVLLRKCNLNKALKKIKQPATQFCGGRTFQDHGIARISSLRQKFTCYGQKVSVAGVSKGKRFFSLVHHEHLMFIMNNINIINMLWQLAFMSSTQQSFHKCLLINKSTNEQSNNTISTGSRGILIFILCVHAHTLFLKYWIKTN